MRAALDETLRGSQAAQRQARKSLNLELKKLEAQEERLIGLAADGSLAPAKLGGTVLTSDHLPRGEHDRYPRSADGHQRGDPATPPRKRQRGAAKHNSDREGLPHLCGRLSSTSTRFNLSNGLNILELVGLIYLCATNSPTGVSTTYLRQIRARPAAGNELTQTAPQHRRNWSRLSDEARSIVIARYAEGESTTLLAEEFGVAKSTILGILRANNVVVRRQPLTAMQVAEAARLYESGLSLSQVAEHLQVNQETMRVAIIKTGITMRAPTGT